MARKGKTSKATANQVVQKTKQKVVQKVTVNIGGRRRGGRKSTARQTIQRPPPVQIFNSMAGPVPQGESMLQSAQILNRLLEPVNMRLDALVRRQAEPAPRGNMDPPQIRDPDHEPQIAENNNREIVVEQQMEQLVEPQQAMVESKPRQLEVAESADGPAQPAVRGTRFNYETITMADATDLKVRRKTGDTSAEPSLEEVVRHFDIRIPQNMRTREGMLHLLETFLENRNANRR